MRLIPVLDIRRGQAVHAVAGQRSYYGPLRSRLHPGTDPVALASAAIEAWGLPDLYLADLDAILGEASPRFETIQAIADLGLDLWVDAGIRGPGEATALVEAGVRRVIVGLETIRGPVTLADVVAEIGEAAVVFSLDLREGLPMVETFEQWGTDQPAEIARRAIDESGVRRVILLDLARVGTGQGVASAEFARRPDVEWLVGGGVSGLEDLEGLARAGFDGVLVGSALHDGRLSPEDLRSIRRWDDRNESELRSSR